MKGLKEFKMLVEVNLLKLEKTAAETSAQGNHKFIMGIVFTVVLQ